jgi:uncharacterized protein (DUF1330 family)
MSAFVVVEASVRDPASRDRYAAQVGPTLAKHGGEVVAFGPWQTLFGSAEYDNGMLVVFPDKAAALAWYNDPAYQALLDLRGRALDCRFRLVG